MRNLTTVDVILFEQYRACISQEGQRVPETPIVSSVDSHTRKQSWEYLVITVAPAESLSQARQRLVEHAEYGHWELQRTVLYRGGTRRFWLRRKVFKVESTLITI